MKSKEQIEFEIAYFEKLLIESKKKHDELNQIDCLSSEGSSLRATIARIEGKIQVLKWILS